MTLTVGLGTDADTEAATDPTVIAHRGATTATLTEGTMAAYR